MAQHQHILHIEGVVAGLSQAGAGPNASHHLCKQCRRWTTMSSGRSSGIAAQQPWSKPSWRRGPTAPGEAQRGWIWAVEMLYGLFSDIVAQ